MGLILFLTLIVSGFATTGVIQAVLVLGAFAGLVLLLGLRIFEHLPFVSCKKDAADIRAGRCPRCRYDLRQLPSTTCPECGTDTARHLSACDRGVARYRARWL
jgi:hypothetical protein